MPVGPRRVRDVPTRAPRARTRRRPASRWPLRSGARAVQPRGGRSTRYRTPACGGASRRIMRERSLSTGAASRCGRDVVVDVIRSAEAERAPRRAGPSVRPKIGSSVSHGGVAALWTASSGASRAGCGASAVAPRSSQKGARPAAWAGRPSVHSASRTPAKIAVRNTLVTIGGRYFVSCSPPPASYAQAKIAQRPRKRRLPTLDRVYADMRRTPGESFSFPGAPGPPSFRHARDSSLRFFRGSNSSGPAELQNGARGG
jgi:hypothetical protein